MHEHLLAVMVHTHRNPFDSLRKTLNDLGVETYSVSSCKEAQQIVSHRRPHLIFSASSVADGSWASVLAMAKEEEVPLNVIVVDQSAEMKHYISVMERGAYDFVTPPFEHEPMSFLIKSAARDVHARRETSPQLALV